MLITKEDKVISLRRQCELLRINRSSLYYQPQGISEEDLQLMNLLDEQYTQTPFYGVRRMRESLQRLGYEIGRDRVRTLLRSMPLHLKLEAV